MLHLYHQALRRRPVASAVRQHPLCSSVRSRPEGGSELRTDGMIQRCGDNRPIRAGQLEHQRLRVSAGPGDPDDGRVDGLDMLDLLPVTATAGAVGLIGALDDQALNAATSASNHSRAWSRPVVAMTSSIGAAAPSRVCCSSCQRSWSGSSRTSRPGRAKTSMAKARGFADSRISLQANPRADPSTVPG